MKQLILMRHAKSDWEDGTIPDHDRPLNERGLRDAPTMGRLLVSQGLIPELVISSTARRARHTAELAAQEWDRQISITTVGELYHAPLSSWQAAVRALPAHIDRVLMVGHNPGIETFQYHLSGQLEPFKTATVACLEFTETWTTLSATLRNIWRPKELG